MKRLILLVTGALVVPITGCRDREPKPEPAEPNIQPAAPEETAERAEEAPEASEAPRPEAPRPGSTDDEAAEADDAKEARQLTRDAAATLQQMKGVPKLKGLLSKAKGLFIVPHYGRGAVGIGGGGGEGALVARNGGKWSSPVLYDIGGISVGAQIGAEGGEIALLLMSDQALETFHNTNTFSLNAGATLTFADYSKIAGSSTLGEGQDIVFWSATEGAFAGVALGVTDIAWDDDENKAYFGRAAEPSEVLSGRVSGRGGDLERGLTGL